ncbi:MAG: hypothetical protein SFW08_09735, partial [Gemmatimonadaceae bacterium]|nr:hypothetical protein [Gemmatimonadaceae bacterium]
MNTAKVMRLTQSPTVSRVLALRHRTRCAGFAPALVLLAGLSIGCASSGNSPADAAQLPDTLSAAQREDLVRTLDAQTRRYFAHFGNREGAPYDSALAAFRSAASRSASRLTFDSAAYRFTAWLSQGHTHFSDPWLTARYGQPLGFVLEPRAEGWLVRASDVAGLVRGDVVTHVDQEPIESFYATRRELIDFGAEHQRRRRLGRNSVWWPMQFSLTTADGRTIAVDRRRNPAPATTAPTVPHRWLVQDSVAYVRIA